MQRLTTFAKTDETSRKWYVVDAADAVLGRMSVRIATILMGKHKPEYTPHVDTGDFVVVINAQQVHLTGNKLDQKFQHRYSGYPGGHKSVSYRQIREEQPEKLIELAVRRMLPKNALGQRMLKKMKVYAGSEHPHDAQHPEILELA